MLDTGIIRRIDELGRVVVPKEIRKKLKIHEGDPLEIYTDGSDLILKKYSPMTEQGVFIEAVADGLSELTGVTCIVCDSSSIIYSSAVRYKGLIGREVSIELLEIMKNRQSMNFSKIDGGKTLPIALDFNGEVVNQVVVPIIDRGDCYGAVVLLDNNQNRKLSIIEVKLAELSARCLAKQFE